MYFCRLKKGVMVFSSIAFLFYFLPVFLLIYYLVPAKWQNLTLLLASLVFYAYGAPKFLPVFIVMMLLNWMLTKWMHDSPTLKRKKWLLAASVTLNLLVLGYFKYMNFFVDNLNALLQLTDHNLIIFNRIALPIGISFFTFQSITYTVDVFRGDAAPLKRCTDYMLYISMFPQLIAGPIVRFNSIAAQISERQISMEARVNGFCRFMIGLGKKVLIANQLALLADPIFAMSYQEISTPTAWIGILAYTFQIYFDFSGYSDMAIGLGKMLGFRFPENFDAPYTSLSVSEFWRRWHITLGAFMKSYLYIPLGGNRKGVARTYLNLVIVFLLSGFWHGASWNFVMWGAFHGIFLILDRLFMLKTLDKLGRIPAMLLTFLAVTAGWVLFRTETLAGAVHFYQAMFSFRSGTSLQWQPQHLFLILAAIISFVPATKIGQKAMDNLFADHYSKRSLILILILVFLIIAPLSVGSLASNNFNPFIYFRF